MFCFIRYSQLSFPSCLSSIHAPLAESSSSQDASSGTSSSLPISSSSSLSSSSQVSSSSALSSSSTGLPVTNITPQNWRNIVIYAHAPSPTILTDLYVEVQGEAISGIARFALTWNSNIKAYTGYAHTPDSGLVGPWRINLASSSNGFKSDTLSISVSNTQDTLWGSLVGPTLIDNRSGSQSYNTVYIGDQLWMAQNLNYGTMIIGKNNQVNDTLVEKYCYADGANNCSTYGGMYQWAEMMGLSHSCNASDCSAQIQSPHQGICPTGWHIPTDGEWNTFTSFFGVSTSSADTVVWQGSFASLLKSTDMGGNNSLGFTILAAGFRWWVDSSFHELGYSSNFWAANQTDSLSAFSRRVDTSHVGVYHSDGDKFYGFAVRCVHN